MSQLSEVLKRTEPEHLVDYLLTGTTDKIKKEADATYSEQTDAASEQFLNSLEQLFPEANRQNDELISIITEFFSRIADVYMEIGFLSGIQLSNNLEKACWKFKDNDSSTKPIKSF